MSEETKKFEGWAVVELFGHSREAGYVTTEYFGSGALFRIDVPELPEREVILIRPEYIGNTFAPAGSKVQRSAVVGRTRFIGPGAIYAMNPCSEDAARKAIEAMSSRDVKIIELAEQKQQERERWISVEEKLPHTHTVLGYIVKGWGGEHEPFIDTVCYFPAHDPHRAFGGDLPSGEWRLNGRDEDPDRGVVTVTYWRPLPRLPGEAQTYADLF